jgi:hypothetical protein
MHRCTRALRRLLVTSQAHSVEAGIAFSLARRADPSNALGWALQTFLLGYPSLTLLRSRSKRAAR